MKLPGQSGFITITLPILIITVLIGATLGSLGTYFFTQSKSKSQTGSQPKNEFISCIDSDAGQEVDGIYTKGVVTTYQNGEKQVFSDECTGSKLQVNERYCNEISKDKFVNSVTVYDCANGCFDGACLTEEKAKNVNLDDPISRQDSRNFFNLVLDRLDKAGTSSASVSSEGKLGEADNPLKIITLLESSDSIKFKTNTESYVTLYSWVNPQSKTESYLGKGVDFDYKKRTGSIMRKGIEYFIVVYEADRDGFPINIYKSDDFLFQGNRKVF